MFAPPNTGLSWAVRTVNARAAHGDHRISWLRCKHATARLRLHQAARSIEKAGHTVGSAIDDVPGSLAVRMPDGAESGRDAGPGLPNG